MYSLIMTCISSELAIIAIFVSIIQLHLYNISKSLEKIAKDNREQ